MIVSSQLGFELGILQMRVLTSELTCLAEVCFFFEGESRFGLATFFEIVE
jgi:hypothetical protein